MMNIDARLNTRSINNAIEQIERFKKELQTKLAQFVSELAEVGIEIAKQNIRVEEDGVMVDRSGLVQFSKDVSTTVDGVQCIIVATPTPYVTHWKRSKEGKEVLSAEVNPLLMAEFGSGVNAIDGHAGTFPSETAKKNVAHGSWAWYDTQGGKHISTGNTPTRPLFKAKQEMENQIREIAQRVFST
jgi:hypothetical protein